MAIRAVVWWSGRPPDPRLARHLERSGVRIERRRTGGATAPTSGDDALEVIATIAERGVPRPAAGGHTWIWLPAQPPSPAAVAEAVNAGAYDVIPATSPPDALAARLLARLAELATQKPAAPQAPDFVADSAVARRFLTELAHAARTSMPVLLTGETGTGKEVAARLLHEWSSRRNKQFIPINCAAIPNDLLESELFGYAKGAFSGAVQSYDGQLSAAEHGSVFLDEVDDTPFSFQLKLLRVLEDRTVSRLGENRWRQVDFRIIAATNRDLRLLIARGAFGADLYERLAIVSIRVPPLRDRLEDLPALARHMFARFYREESSARDRHHVTELTPEALAVLRAHHWPGNIRELRNVIFGALVRKRSGTELLASDLLAPLVRRHDAMDVRATSSPSESGVTRQPAFDVPAIEAAIANGTFNLRTTVENLERAAVTAALARTTGNAAAAAALLGEVGHGGAQDPGATVRAMMRRLGVETAHRPRSHTRRAGR